MIFNEKEYIIYEKINYTTYLNFGINILFIYDSIR